MVSLVRLTIGGVVGWLAGFVVRDPARVIPDIVVGIVAAIRPLRLDPLLMRAISRACTTVAQRGSPRKRIRLIFVQTTEPAADGMVNAVVRYMTSSGGASMALASKRGARLPVFWSTQMLSPVHARRARYL
ncbi:MAG: GlsB/YeaQ/YmgE family stress response membrane protein [Janthinobacterium lividum]